MRQRANKLSLQGHSATATHAFNYDSTMYGMRHVGNRYGDQAYSVLVYSVLLYSVLHSLHLTGPLILYRA